MADSIKKTQKRANALKEHHDPVIPGTCEGHITNALEEKDREEFTRLKRNQTEYHEMTKTARDSLPTPPGSSPRSG
ncbi:MAG: V-type ATP synthase subunit D [Roseburia sp.]